MLGYAISVVLACILAWLFVAYREVLGDRQWYRDNEERLGDVIDKQMSRARDAEKMLALSVKNCQQLMDEVESLNRKRLGIASDLATSADRCLQLEKEMAIDREWKADAVIRLASHELAKQELLANLAQPFRKRKPWSDLISRLFRDEGSKTS